MLSLELRKASTSNLSEVDFWCVLGCAASIFEIIERTPEIDAYSTEGSTPEQIDGHIVFKDVNFIYPTRPEATVLNNLSLEIKPGQTIALVGSRFVRLYTRFKSLQFLVAAANQPFVHCYCVITTLLLDQLQLMGSQLSRLTLSICVVTLELLAKSQFCSTTQFGTTSNTVTIKRFPKKSYDLHAEKLMPLALLNVYRVDMKQLLAKEVFNCPVGR